MVIEKSREMEHIITEIFRQVQLDTYCYKYSENCILSSFPLLFILNHKQ